MCFFKYAPFLMAAINRVKRLYSNYHKDILMLAGPKAGWQAKATQIGVIMWAHFPASLIHDVRTNAILPDYG